MLNVKTLLQLKSRIALWKKNHNKALYSRPSTTVSTGSVSHLSATVSTQASISSTDCAGTIHFLCITLIRNHLCVCIIGIHIYSICGNQRYGHTIITPHIQKFILQSKASVYKVTRLSNPSTTKSYSEHSARAVKLTFLAVMTRR